MAWPKMAFSEHHDYDEYAMKTQSTSAKCMGWTTFVTFHVKQKHPDTKSITNLGQTIDRIRAGYSFRLTPKILHILFLK